MVHRRQKGRLELGQGGTGLAQLPPPTAGDSRQCESSYKSVLRELAVPSSLSFETELSFRSDAAARMDSSINQTQR
mgnify:FL=1